MAQKRRRKRSNRLKTLLLFIFTPIVVWFLAFLVWFYGIDLTRLTTKEKTQTQPNPKALRPVEQQRQRPPDETIFEEDRQKLDEILKQRR